MPSPSPEARAKIAETLRRRYADPNERAKSAETAKRYFEQNPDAIAQVREAGRKGGRVTSAKRAETEAEAVELRAAFLAVRSECDQLHAELVATREALTRANANLEEARAEVGRLRRRLA